MAEDERDPVKPNSVGDRSVGQEAPAETGLGTAIRERFRALGGVDLEPPPREAPREPPDFD